MNKLISTKKCVSLSLVSTSETAKSHFFYNWLKIGTPQPKLDKIHFFTNTRNQSIYHDIQKEIVKLEFIQVVNFEIIDSLEHNGTKYPLTFDDSCEEICNSKASVNFTTAGRHREDNLFHRSEHGPNVELQNRHIVLVNSPIDVMQDSTLSAQSCPGPDLNDWYWDATSVPYGHFSLPPTDGGLLPWTSTGSIPSKFYVSDRLNHSNPLHTDYTKSFYFPSVPIILPQMQNSFPSVLSKRIYQVSRGMHSKSSWRKPANQYNDITW